MQFWHTLDAKSRPCPKCANVKTKFMMKVSIRKRKTSDEKSSLFLDFLQDGVRKRESLKLTIYTNPITRTEKFENSKTMQLVKRIQSEKIIELQDGQHGTKRISSAQSNFIAYFKQKADERKGSSGNFGNWDSAHKHLVKCFGEKFRMADMSVESCNFFKLYLDTIAKTKSNKSLSQNTKCSYLNKLKACLKEAYRDRLIAENLSDFVRGFKPAESNREYLTFEELESLATTQCMYPVLKAAFIFSCLTGIRWSDIHRLTWLNLRHSDKRGYELSFNQKKTGGKEYLPISEQAVELLGERGEDSRRLFVGLSYSAYMNVALYKWVADAGIKKKITFHCARHTHAVLLLENGTDIYTVSKMLGHREIKTTQIYAKIVDSKKVEAVNCIPKLKF